MVYAVHLCTGDVITTKDLPYEITRQNLVASKKIPGTLFELEKSAIEDTLHFTENDTAKAAKILGISRTTLYRKLKEYNLER